MSPENLGWKTLDETYRKLEGKQSCEYWLWLGVKGLCQTSTKSCGRQGRLNSKVGPRSLTDVTGLADEQVLEMINDLEKFDAGWHRKPCWLAPHESNAWFSTHAGERKHD